MCLDSQTPLDWALYFLLSPQSIPTTEPIGALVVVPFSEIGLPTIGLLGFIASMEIDCSDDVGLSTIKDIGRW